jgi:hypothetical protein
MFGSGLIRGGRASLVSAAGALGLGALLWAAPAAAASSVAVSPASVPAGGSVVISGSIPTTGSASCAQSDAAIITATAALFPPDGFGPQAARNASGAFSVTYTVPPSTPAGTYSLGLRCGGGNVGVSATLTVTAQVEQTPSGAPSAGLGGASRGGDSAPWVAGGVAAGILAVGIAGAGIRRRRSGRAGG